MTHRDIAFSLVQDLLAAPGSEEGWRTFLLHLCHALDGSGANFISHDFTNRRAHVSVTANTSAEAVALYHEYWSGLDVWADKASHLAPGSVVTGDELIGRADFERTAFCNDFGRHYDVLQCLGGVVESSAGTMSVISVNADDRRKRFDAEDCAVIAVLMPALQRALQLHRRLDGADLMAANAMDVLDRLHHGVVLLSAQGAVLSTNRAADAIVRAMDGLTIDSGEFRAATVALTHQLRLAIGQAVRTDQERAIDSHRTALPLPRPSGRRAFSVVIAPLPQRAAHFGQSPAAAVMFVTDPEPGVVPDAEVIRAMFGLTAGEAELVRVLVSGLTVQQAAGRLGLQVDTVRKRLKQIFEKTDTHRQADLVRLVLVSVAPCQSA